MKAVRADENLKKIPFIMVTAESKTENVIAAKKAGVNNYIVKPFNAQTLKAKIDQALAAPVAAVGAAVQWRPGELVSVAAFCAAFARWAAAEEFLAEHGPVMTISPFGIASNSRSLASWSPRSPISAVVFVRLCRVFVGGNDCWTACV